MPELPEVEALARFLGDKTAGRTVDRVEVGSLSALKTFDPPVDALAGRSVTGTDRRGKFLIFEVDDLFLVLHLARAGWIRWSDTIPQTRVRPGKGPLALRLRLDDGSGFDATEAGTEKRLAVYVARQLDDVEGIARLGPDPLDADFDAGALREVLRRRGGQLKAALTDQSAIAGVGNAYSDDVLHAARLSPFKSADKLDHEEYERLHSALVSVLSGAVERSAGLPAAGLKSEKRAGMRVHGRAGEDCPVCGDRVREVSFSSRSLQYCPTCQTGGRPLADRRLSRLLK